MSPEIPALAGRRAGSMQNPGEETGWARCGAGPRAPRPLQTPAPTRTPQHPGVHLPARGCCRTAALRGHPTRYVPATRSRGHRRCCPHRGSLGRAGVSRPATHPVPIRWPGWCQGTGTPTCGSGGCPTLASCGQKAFPSLLVPPSLCPSVSPARLLARARGVRAAWSHSLPRHRCPPAGTASPGDSGVGTGVLCCSRGWERTRCSQEPRVPGNVALSPCEGVTEVPPGWGVVSGCFRDPRFGLFNSVSFQLWSDPLGNPSVLLQMFSLY